MVKKLAIPVSFIGPLLITVLVMAAHISFGVLDGWDKFAVAIVTAILAELVFHKLMTGKWRNLSSAYISGTSTGILIRSPMLWPFALCAAISIASKYVFRFKGRHIWNPTNFGVVIMLLIASDSMAILSIQWGSNMWAMLAIWLVGVITIIKVKKFHICAVYVVSFVFFAWIRSLMGEGIFAAEVAPLTGPMYQLFVLFMITDPKTIVSTRKGQMLVAFLIALAEMFFRFGEAVYAPFYALFIIGPIALVIDTLYRERKDAALKTTAGQVSTARS